MTLRIAWTMQSSTRIIIIEGRYHTSQTEVQFTGTTAMSC